MNNGNELSFETRKSLFSIRYNILALLNAGIGVLNSFINISVFGVSANADALFIAQTIYSALSLLSLSLVEQFIYYYHNYRNKSIEEASSFYSSVMTWTIFIQFVFMAALFLCKGLVLFFFSSGLDESRKEIVSSVLKYYIVSLFFAPITTLNNTLLNAEKRYTYPYIFQTIPLLVNLITYCYMLIRHTPNVVVFGFANMVGILLYFVVQEFYMFKNGYLFRVEFGHADLKLYFRDSILMRFGHNIHNFFIQPIISNILASLPIGLASSYGYASKIIGALVSITLGPSANMLTTNISIAYSKHENDKLKRSINEFIRISLEIIIPCIVALYFSIPYIFKILNKHIGVANINSIQLIFIGLGIWQIMLLIEGGYDRVLFAANNNIVFIIENSIALIIIWISLHYLVPLLAVLAIPLSLIIAQLLNNYVYIKSALRVLDKNDSL